MRRSTSGVYTVKSVPSGLCVDVYRAATTDGARLLQWSCHGATNQQWRFTAAQPTNWDVPARRSIPPSDT